MWDALVLIILGVISLLVIRKDEVLLHAGCLALPICLLTAGIVLLLAYFGCISPSS